MSPTSPRATHGRRQGRIGERYILGGENMSLAAILAAVAALSGKAPPRVRLPIAAVVPIAIAAEAVARVTGKEPFVTLDGLRMARKKMYFSSARAVAELGYRMRPVREALAEAIEWFRGVGYSDDGFARFSWPSLAIWLYLLLAHGGFWREAPRAAPQITRQTAPRWPEVVAVVPARDEAESIAAAIGSSCGSVIPAASPSAGRRR